MLEIYMRSKQKANSMHQERSGPNTSCNKRSVQGSLRTRSNDRGQLLKSLNSKLATKQKCVFTECSEFKGCWSYSSVQAQNVVAVIANRSVLCNCWQCCCCHQSRNHGEQRPWQAWRGTRRWWAQAQQLRSCPWNNSWHNGWQNQRSDQR